MTGTLCQLAKQIRLGAHKSRCDHSHALRMCLLICSRYPGYPPHPTTHYPPSLCFFRIQQPEGDTYDEGAAQHAGAAGAW